MEADVLRHISEEKEQRYEHQQTKKILETKNRECEDMYERINLRDADNKRTKQQCEELAVLKEDLQKKLQQAYSEVSKTT